MKKKNLLEKYDIRDTQPRRELVNIISSFGRRHFSVEDILKKGKVSRATTFRAVNLFAQKGLLHSIDLGKGFKLYELALDSGHHDHLYCIKCGKIIEFEDKHIENLQAKACQEKNFKPIKHTLRITGLCKECR